MKVLAFFFILAAVANAAVLDARQADCTKPLSAIASLPAVCGTTLQAFANVVMMENATVANFSAVNSNLDEFCTSGCVQPVVDYYTCLGENDFANILDGFLCGTNTPGGTHCFELWENVYYQNGSNPQGVSYTDILKNCRDPLNCNNTCRTELNKAKDNLGCCLAGVVEFSSCRALAEVRFEECSIVIPPICEGVIDVPTTPAPEYPTSGTDCVYPLDDPDYPSDCKSNLTAVENVAISESDSENGFSIIDPSTNVTAVLTGFCVPECVRPLVAFYNCTGEPDYANAINGFFCGKQDNQYCLEKLPTIFYRPGGTGGSVNPLTIRNECNNPLDCSSACMTELTEAKEAAGCCLAGAVEFTICGPLEQVRFDECGIDVGDVCTGIDLSSARATMPFSFTLLSLVAYLTFKFA